MGFFLPMPPVAGGATEKSWHGLAREFARRGHDVTVLSRTWPGWPRSEIIDGVQFRRIGGHAHTTRLTVNLFLDFWWSIRVWCALPAGDVTVVNCIALPVWLGWLRRRAGRLAVMTGRMPKGQYRLYRRVDRVLAVSSPVRAAVLTENPRLADAIRVTGYPIHWTRLAAPRPPASPETPVTLGFVGRLHVEKGLDLLVAALAKLAGQSGLPSWKIILCGPDDVARGGSGPAYAQRLREQLTATLPAGALEIRPAEFDDERLAEVYRSFDIFCYPSLAAHGETFGVAVAEAMAAGAVPVVSALPCFSDFVTDGVDGEVFDHGATDAPGRLAAILARLIADPARRTRLSAAAQTTARRYDFTACAERLLTDFSTLK